MGAVCYYATIEKEDLANVHKAVFGVCTTSIPSQNPFALSEYNMLAFSFFHCNNMKGGVHICNNYDAVGCGEGEGGRLHGFDTPLEQWRLVNPWHLRQRPNVLLSG